MTSGAIEAAVPLARSAAGAPIAYATLGASFHLEELRPDDGERIANACARVHALLGASLRWTWSSVHTSVEPFAPTDLELAASYPALLRDAAPDPGPDVDPRARAGAIALAAAHYDRFGVCCHGGADRNVASPSTFRFFATATAGKDPGRLRSHAMLAFTAPPAVTLAELQAATTEIAGMLRLRWGAAGFTYGAWELDRYGETRDAIYAHARRHPGFDVGQHTTWMPAFHDRLRTVSWLTFLGPALAATLRAAGDTLESDDLVTVEPCGEGVVLRAGERPQAGDVNRGDVPAAYARVDRRVRALRAGEGLHFYAPWSAATTEAWLRRFEGPARPPRGGP